MDISFGINIDMKGNVEQQANRAASALSNTARSVEHLGKAADDSLAGLLAIQSSLFVLTKFSKELMTFGTGLISGITSAFTAGVQSAGELQKSFVLLRLVTGDSFGKAREEVEKLAASTDLATKDVVDVSQRLIGVGLSVNQVFGKINGSSQSGLTNIAAALTRLSGMERTRALNSIGNIFQDINSVALLLNTTVPKAVKQAFSSASTEAQKFDVVLKFLDTRFSNIFAPGGIQDTFSAAFQKSIQNISDVLNRAFLPVIELLTPTFAKLAAELDDLRKNEKVVQSLSEAFLFLGRIAVFVVNVMASAARKLIDFVGKYPLVTKLALALTLAAGAIATIVGAITFAVFSITLFSLALGRLNTFLLGTTGATNLWTSSTMLASKALNFLSFDVGLAYARMLSISTIGARLAAGATNLWGLSILRTATALGVLALRLGVIGVIFTALAYLPQFIESFNSKLAAMVNLIKIAITAVSTIVGFLVGGPAGAALLGGGTFAAFEAFSPTKEISPDRKTDNIKSGETASAEALDKRIANLQEQMLEFQKNNPIEIENTLLLDGEVVAKSVNKKNRGEKDRMGSSRIASE